MSDVTLLGAVHDPEGRIAALLPADLPLLQRHYTRIHVICGMATLPSTIEALRRAGVIVISGDDIPINARPYALGPMAAHAEWEFVHLCDFDSALHWARCWPDELDHVNATIATHDFLLLGRTARAMATLPEAQRETERLINLLFARTTGDLDSWRLPSGGAGMRADFKTAKTPRTPRGKEKTPVLFSAFSWRPWRLGGSIPLRLRARGQAEASPTEETLMDICTGAWGFSRRGIAAIHARSRVTDIGFHAEWLLIARDTPGLRCAYLPCEGLEYETADRYADQIAAAGGLDAWQARQNADIRQWQQRIGYITQIAETIRAVRGGR